MRQPDILIILESHLNDQIIPIPFHSDYDILLNNPSIGLDVAHSRGRGTLILGRKGIILKKIFPILNTSRKAIAIVEYEDGKSLVIGAFHLDISSKKEETERLLTLLELVQRKYSNSDVCFYTDLNLH